jgi:hypothetical protein
MQAAQRHCLSGLTVIATSPQGDEAIWFFMLTWIASRSLSSPRPLRAGPVGSQ